MGLLFMVKFEQLKSQMQAVERYVPICYTDHVQLSALTSDFDRIFELLWKTLKEYMFQNLGILQAKTGSPREILKLAFAQNLIDREEIWLEMLYDRNDDTHHYKESAAILYASKIETEYLHQVACCIETLKQQIPEETIPSGRMPESLLDAADKANQPLHIYIEEIRKKQGFKTVNEVIANWSGLK